VKTSRGFIVNIGVVPVSVSRFTAYVFHHDTRVQIEWTGRLTDHLELLVGSTWKSLYVSNIYAILKRA
jgi:hypothetical protein